MGMFDDIEGLTHKCPECGTVITGFQSKSGPCELLRLKYWMVDDFYAWCKNCGLRIRFTLTPTKRPYLPMEAYSCRVWAKGKDSHGHDTWERPLDEFRGSKMDRPECGHAMTPDEKTINDWWLERQELIEYTLRKSLEPLAGWDEIVDYLQRKAKEADEAGRKEPN